MRRLLLAGAIAALSIMPFAQTVRAADAGILIKASGAAVYYVFDGKRYVFPNNKVYSSWYQDFSQVQTVEDSELARYLISGNVTYRPGARLVKIISDPKVYAVDAGGTLRWIASESAAKALYGTDWNKKVDDIPDAFFLNYRQGEAVYTAGDFDPASASSSYAIADDLAFKTGAPAPKEFRAVKLGTWSDGATWGGVRPASGARVVIPSGTRVIYDMEDSGSLRSLEVAGALEFWKETPKDLRLSARTIKVTGTLSVGSAETPFAKRSAEILLTGIGTDPDEGLIVDGGTLDLHGSPAAAWTRLSVSAEKGDSKITLEAPVGWKEGDEIAIAPTSGDPGEAERRRITSVAGTAVTLNASLEHAHSAKGAVRGEVALLDRNVSVIGAGSGRGGGIVVGPYSTVRLSGVELSGLGRSVQPTARPLEFSGAGGQSASYMKGSVIHDSGNGCVGLSQTDGMTVADSAAFEVRGHCYATDTGAETRNVFRNLLVMKVRKSESGAGSPSAFLLRNPDNDIVNSAVAGSEGHGYWYMLGKSARRLNGTSVAPNETALGSFSGNAVHSVAASGLFVDEPTPDSPNYLPPSKAIFSGLSAAYSGDYGFWVRGNNVEVSGAELTANRVGGSFSGFAASFKDSTVTGQPDAATSTVPVRYGFVFGDGPMSVSGVTFRNFLSEAPDIAASFGFRDKNDRLSDPRNSVRNITYVDANRWYAPDPQKMGDRLAVVRDLDSGKSYTARSPFLDFGCVRDAVGNVHACPGQYTQLMVALRSVSVARSVTFERTDGKGFATLDPGPAFDGVYAYVNVAEGESYRFKSQSIDRLAVEYEGTAKPLTLRFLATERADVRGEGVTWVYDAAAREIVLTVPPGGSADVSWQ